MLRKREKKKDEIQPAHATIERYRPVTLFNVDYKLFAKIVT